MHKEKILEEVKIK